MSESFPYFVDFKPSDLGLHLIVPVDVGGGDLVNWMILRVYERVTLVQGGKATDLWMFRKEVKRFAEPHLSFEEYEKCEQCREAGRSWGDVPEDEVLIQANNATKG